MFQPYLENEPLHFSLSEYMLLGSMTSYWNVVFYLIFFPLIKPHMSDELLAALGSFILIVHMFIYIVARAKWLIFFSRFIDVGAWAACVGLQCVLLSFLEPNETATLFALWTIISTVVHLPAAFFYSWVFRVTASISPSFAFVVPTVTTMLPVGLFIYLYIGARRRRHTFE